MRNWQRSAIALMAWRPVSLTRSRKTSVGIAAYGSGRTPRQSNTRSAMCVLPDHGLTPVAQGLEEAVDPLPCLLAAVEALPVQPDHADQLVEGVDRHEVGAGIA